MLLCTTCTDINECIDDNAGCSHTCVNTPGSYHCKCNRGYELQADLHNCSGDSSLCTVHFMCLHKIFTKQNMYVPTYVLIMHYNEKMHIRTYVRTHTYIYSYIGKVSL